MSLSLLAIWWKRTHEISSNRTFQGNKRKTRAKNQATVAHSGFARDREQGP